VRRFEVEVKDSDPCETRAYQTTDRATTRAYQTPPPQRDADESGTPAEAGLSGLPPLAD
jgi:hypothetical protein